MAYSLDPYSIGQSQGRRAGTWRKLRTTNVIERCFVEVRRRTMLLVCFVNAQSVDRIIYSTFQRFNLE